MSVCALLGVFTNEAGRCVKALCLVAHVSLVRAVVAGRVGRVVTAKRRVLVHELLAIIATVRTISKVVVRLEWLLIVRHLIAELLATVGVHVSIRLVKVGAALASVVLLIYHNCLVATTTCAVASTGHGISVRVVHESLLLLLLMVTVTVVIKEIVMGQVSGRGSGLIIDDAASRCRNGRGHGLNGH